MRHLASVALIGALMTVPTSALGALPQQSGVVDLLAHSDLRIDGAVAGDAAGSSVSAAGDVNGDGRDDVMIGVASADGNGRTNSGSVYVVFGAADRVAVDLASLGSSGFRIDGAVAGDAAGTSVSAAGDVNGDGRDDVVIGAHQAGNNGRGASGSAYVVFGSSDPVTVDLASLGSSGFRIDGAVAGDAAGISVSAAGDVNGDGRDDVVVGANQADNNGRVASGSAYVVFGSASPGTVDLASLGSAGFRIDGATADDRAGGAVRRAGDVNGDGRVDVVVGAVRADNNGRTNSGSVYVVFGSASPVTIDLGSLGPAGFRIDGEATWDMLGVDVSGAGDVNGDGREDVVTGAWQADNNGRGTSGSAYVVFGSASPVTVDLGSLGSSGFRIDGAANGDSAGIRVARAGDANGDGRDDVIVAAQFADGAGRSDAGAAYVVYGSTSPAAVDLASLGSAGFRVAGAAVNEYAGSSVAGAGDVNGDGRDDVVVGAVGADANGRTNAGTAYVAYGFGSPGLSYGALSGSVGQAVTPHGPVGVARTGTATFSVTPALPDGLVLDAFTGAISGIPTRSLGATTFTVTMTDLTGSVGVPLLLSVAAAPGPPAPPGVPETPVTPPDRVDSRAPVLSLRVPPGLRAGRAIHLQVRCDEACRVSGRARGGRGTALDLVAGRWAPLRITLPSALLRGRGAVPIILVATDTAGNRSRLARRVALVR